jgi:hypothetical protein
LIKSFSYSSLCQIRISAHELKIERDRYKKPYVERSQRICEKCSSNQTEDELHFIINCPLYIDNREIMFNNIGELCPKFKDLPNEAKFICLFTNENISVLKLLGKSFPTSVKKVNTSFKNVWRT